MFPASIDVQAAVAATIPTPLPALARVGLGELLAPARPPLTIAVGAGRVLVGSRA